MRHHLRAVKLKAVCNLYTFKLSRDEVRGLLQHYKLIGREWTDLMTKDQAGMNADGRVFPKYPAPVVIERGDGKQAMEMMKWGLPGPTFGKPDARPSFITNVRNTASKHWTSWLAGTSVVVGKDKNEGGRCLVPAASFAEPDEHTSNPRINRWFRRADGLPFFFAGIWREWTGDHGTIKKPDVGKHRLFAFLTTSAADDVKPYHSKATPLILRTAEDVERWLHGNMMEALELQKPTPAKSLVVVPEKKKAA